MMHGSEFIDVSTQIVGLGAPGSRSATSRAYYGSFHAVLELLDEVECRLPTKGASHDLAHQCLGKAADERAKQAAHLLADLHSRRIKADYRLDQLPPNDLQYGQFSIAAAQKILSLLHEFRDHLTRNPSLKDDWVAEVGKLLAIRQV
ncbi:MAG: hypothetical protein SFV23_21715 [Planctomycetaceae bacterium]|nr:hypothetical protein [Planctomycetaceae bacterium]